MITLITGAPGAGKTSLLVSLLAQLAKGRAIYADGIPDLVVPHLVLDDPTRWPELVPDGAAVVIDEVQRIWRPRGSGSRVPPAVEAFETHRHRGLDFFVITQHPNLLDQNVRRLVGRHIHLRDVGVFGRWWYEWPEATDIGTFKTAPIKKRYKIDKASFALYKSASVHIKPIRSIPPVLFVLLGSVVLLGALVTYAYKSIGGRLSPAAAPAAAASAPASPSSAPVVASPHLVEAAAPASVTVAHSDWSRFDPGSKYYPDELAGCIAFDMGCKCWTNGSPGRVVQIDPALCIGQVTGRYLVGPGRPQVVRTMPDPAAGPSGLAEALSARPAPPSMGGT